MGCDILRWFSAALVCLFIAIYLLRNGNHGKSQAGLPTAAQVTRFLASDAVVAQHSSALFNTSQTTATHRHAGLFECAFYVNADGSDKRRAFMEKQLQDSDVRFERWRAIHGHPSLLQTHASYFQRGVERHLYTNHNKSGMLSGWGTIGTYLSHLLLFEHIVQRWAHNDDAAFLILQDDTQLEPDWLQRLAKLKQLMDPAWQRVLLVWWGLARDRDCHGHICIVRPPAGPTESGPECCGKRFFHGLQAWIVRRRNLRCILRRLKRRPIKNIDALMVQCNCPHTYALLKSSMLGRHMDRELGSERAAVNSIWRVQVEPNISLKRSARRNIRKVQLTHAIPRKYKVSSQSSSQRSSNSWRA